MEAQDKGSSPLGSVDKALQALDALAAAGPEGVGLGELAAHLGLNKTSLHRTLAALRFRGYAEQVAGNYRLGSAAVALGETYLGPENLPALMRPVLDAICAQTSELVHLGVLSGSEIVYLDKVEPDRAVRVWSAIGKRSPAERTAMGRAILATMEPDRLPAILGSTTQDAIPGEIADARRRGWAEEVESNEPGIACVAVSITRSGHPIAAVSVTAPIERMGSTRRKEIGALLRKTTDELLQAPFECGLEPPKR